MGGKAARAAEKAGAVPAPPERAEDGATQPMTIMFTMQDTGRPVTSFLPEGCPCYDRVEDLPQGRRLFWDDNRPNGGLSCSVFSSEFTSLSVVVHRGICQFVNQPTARLRRE